MYRINNISALSVNRAYKGRRFRTPDHKMYKDRLAIEFRRFKLPLIDDRAFIYIKFGITDQQDVTNGIKMFEDALCNHIGINDRKVGMLICEKEVVKRVDRFIEFGIYNSREELLNEVSKDQ